MKIHGFLMMTISIRTTLFFRFFAPPTGIMALDRGGSKGSLDRENHEAEPSGFRDPNYPRAPEG